MKKLIVSIAVLLPGLLAYSQEANDSARYAEFTFVPRLDINPTYTATEDGLGFNHGNSSIYTLFEGSLSEHFSWTVANHWLHNGGDYGWLYRNTGRSDDVNWLDYFQLDFSYSGWTFSLGKTMIATGGFEFDEWDWDVYSDLASPLWDGMACYQWGGAVTWTTPSEMSSYTLQMTTSPYGEHPFSSNLWAYSFQWRGEYDWFSVLGSVSALEYEKRDFDWLWAVGMNFAFSDELDFTLDLNSSCGYDEESWRLIGGCTAQGKLNWAFADDMNLALRGWYATPNRGVEADSMWVAGVNFEWFLLDDDALRLHAYTAYNSVLETVTLSLGVRYNLLFELF